MLAVIQGGSLLFYGYPGLPESWRGKYVHEARYDAPVAVIGDVHGCSEALSRLLPMLEGRSVLVAGDLCDRGPDSKGVIEQLIAREATGVTGNHDLWLMKWGAGEGFDDMALGSGMGGVPTLASYGVNPREVDACWQAVPRHHVDWLLGLHVVIDLSVMGESFWLVHGGLPTGVLPGDRPEPEFWEWMGRNYLDDLLWRATVPERMGPLSRPIIMGHRPRKEPMDNGDVIAIDTGASRWQGAKLTALLLPERRCVSVVV